MFHCLFYRNFQLKWSTILRAFQILLVYFYLSIHSELKRILNLERLTNVLNEKELYSSHVEILDAEFSISQKVLKQKYKRNLQILDDTVICTDNFEKLKKRGMMYLNDDEEVVLKVDIKYLQDIKKALVNKI